MGCDVNKRRVERLDLARQRCTVNALGEEIMRVGDRCVLIGIAGGALALSACGESSGTEAQAVPSADVSSPSSLPTAMAEPVAATIASSTLAESVDTRAAGGPLRIDVDGYKIEAVVPADAGPDPLDDGQEPAGFVLDDNRWMTDCCWLVLTVQDQRPLYPDKQMTGSAQVNGLEWTFYDTAEEGSIQVAITTVDTISVSVGAQERFPGDEAHARAAETVRSMVDTIKVEQS